MRALTGVVFGLCALGAAHAADLKEPVWDSAPGQADWAKAYPVEAAKAGVAGAVKMKCAATAAGLLANCAVVEESPSGQGFGAAALSLATGMVLKPTDASGSPVAGRDLMVPVKFDPAMLRGPGTIIGQPDWLRRPNDEEMGNFYPTDAGRAGGKTAIDCVVTTRGLLEKCAVVRESPSGHGLGKAALAMSAIFVMRPMTRDGMPVGGGKVEIPIHFVAGAEDSPSVTVIRAAPWMSVPDAAQLSEAFPKAAVGKVPFAHVVLRCAIGANGGVRDCTPVSVTPDNRGFAAAATSLASDFKAYPDAKRDQIRRLRIDIPFDFRDPSQTALPVEVYDPIWLRLVSPAYAAQLFPPAAAKAGVRKGSATLECGVRHDGTLRDCGVVSEEPSGLGFGDAALTIAGVMAMNPWTAQGDPVDGARIRLPIRLELPASATPAQPAQTKP
jgi:TonB family protein